MNHTRPFKAGLARYGVGILLAAGLGLFLLAADNLQPNLVNLSYDLPFRGRPVKVPDDVVMVWMDEDSHRELTQPRNDSWDRGLHGQLVERLTHEHARGVVFDIVFSETNATHVPGDERFVRAVRENGKVILAAEYAKTPDGSPTMYRAFDALIDAAADWGFDQVATDQDFIVRRHLHVPPDPDGDNFSSMTWQAAHLLGQLDTQKPENRYVERWMNYYGPPGTIPWVSFYRALAADEFCPAGYFSNKVVFVGGNVKTVFSGQRKDEYRTPYTVRGEFVPGLEVQATQYLNLIRGDWLSRLSPRAELILVVFCAVLFGAGLAGFRPLGATLLAALGAALVTLLAYYLFWSQRLWFPWLIIVMAQIPVALFWSILYNSVVSLVQNRLLAQSLGLYLSPKQVQRILKEPGLRQPGGSKQVASILFSDIAGFSRIAEQLDPAELVQLLNRYYETTIRAIHQTEGTIVDIIGDAIFAIWNAPEVQPDHQAKMLQAALLFQQNVAQFNSKQGSIALRTRVGLHTGEVVVGNVGSSEHFDYAAIGENVNLASRLEGLNKQLGTDVLMTRAALGIASGPWRLRPVGKFRFKGFAQVVDVIEFMVLPDVSGPLPPWFETFAAALETFQQGQFAAAAAGFRRTLELRPGDGPTAFYLHQIQELQTHTLPDGWAGEINLTEK